VSCAKFLEKNLSENTRSQFTEGLFIGTIIGKININPLHNNTAIDELIIDFSSNPAPEIYKVIDKLIWKD
jgi:hypothetical protein